MSSPTGIVQARSLDGGTVTVSAEALAAFVQGHRGPVLQPSSPGYDDARKIWNAMIDRRPALIARASGVADVLHTLKFARTHRILVSVRGGGHNIAGLSVCEGGLVIDQSLLRGVWVDPAARTARVQAGATLADVDRETQLHGLAAILGFVSTTGVAGLTVGGGFGYLTRRHGWTCDNVVSMDVVTPTGQLVRASESENSELFWCLRGGGGNFGIVTSFEYRLYPVGPEILGGAIAWHGAEANAVLTAYEELTRSAPRELTCVAALRLAPPAPWLPKDVHGKPIVAVFVCHTGDPAEGERLIATLRGVRTPVADIVTRRPYVQMQTLLDGTQPPGRRYYWKSEYVGSLPEAARAALIEHAAKITSPHSAILAFHLAGAVNELPADHCPAGNRDVAYIVNIAGSWERETDDPANIGWARDAWQGVRPFSTGGVYLNFLTEEEGAERVRAAYGASMFEKLGALRATYDPDRVLQHNKSLGSD